VGIVQKFGPLSENSSPLLVSQAGYGPEYTSQHCCHKTIDDTMALYRECCFPNSTK